jgi:hypothetical protein
MTILFFWLSLCQNATSSSSNVGNTAHFNTVPTSVTGSDCFIDKREAIAIFWHCKKTCLWTSKARNNKRVLMAVYDIKKQKLQK